MECFLTELGKTLTEKVLNKAIEKSRNIFCFACIVKEFNEEKDKLEAGRETMREKFQVATNKGKGIKDDARLWEEHANKLIQENTETNQRCFLEFCPDCIWKYKRGEDLSKKTKEIRKLMEEKFENVELDRHLPGVERYSSQYYISFESRELKYNELLAALRDDNNYITGLQGMGGTGKTTLAKEVGKQLKTSEKFNHVIDTTVSFTPDIKKIQDDISGPLGLKLEGINESDRPKKLWCRLTGGEKILLIMDDVWGNLNFDEIGIPKSDNHKGCKVLVTTRNLRVCNQMVCEKTIQLDLLNEEEAWSMFKLHANLTDNSSQSILKKGRKIATECKRLPVAIATVASTLKGQKCREEWDVSLKTLQKPVSVGGVGDDLVNIYKCLKFSYDFLKDTKAEGLFLLCSTFPEDAKISTEVLTRLGIGVGLFGDDYGSYKDARTQAAASKNKLLDSCLLLETEQGDVKMHDLFREVAQLIANNEMKIVNFSNKNQKSHVERDKNIKYLICEGNLRDLFASKFDGSKLEILIGNMHKQDIVHIPISFIENIPRLRVLNLSRHSIKWRDRDHHPLSLPQSMKPLSNIRSLSFKFFDLGDISAIGGLQNLETLELTHCAINELPREIEKLENFRLLELKACKIRNNNPFEVIQRCPSLEELYFLDSFNDFCKEITLPTLQRYRLSNSLFKMVDTISRGVSVEWDYFSEATLKYVMKTTELLHLEGTKKGWRNLMPGIVPIDNGMNDLIELDLKNCHQVQCLVDTKRMNYEVPSVFSNLKNVTLYSCSMLVSVFDLSTSRGLLLLEKLEIYDCEQLENIITTECEEIVDGDNDNNKSCNSMFPNLKFLCIEECHQLQFILPCHSAGDFLLLESIKIDSCYELKYIFGQHQDVQLASLKELQLDDVPDFIDIFPEPSCIKGSSNSISKPQSELEQVKSNTFSWSQICCYGYKLRGSTSTKIPLVSEDQPKDCSITLESSSYYPNLWEGAQCLSTSILSHILCNIKEMTLKFLPKIKSVFVMSIASKLSLESLAIRKCNELEHIIVDIDNDSGGNNWGNNVFPKLKELNVGHCEKLEYIFGHIDATDHHQNNNNEVTHLHLPSLECLNLHNLPSLIGMCTKHYCTTLPSLTKVVLIECSKVDITSIGDFIGPNYSNKESSSYYPNIWERAQCLSTSRLSHILCNVKKMILKFLPKIKSVFVMSIASKWSLEFLHIENCDELEHIVVDIEDGSGGNNWGNNVFPKLKELSVISCAKLEYIFGHIDATDHHKNHNNEVTHLHLPSLECLNLHNLPSLIGMCTKHYCTTLPSLTKVVLIECSKVDITSIGDFIGPNYSNEELSVNVEHFLSLEKLKVHYSKVENIFCLNDVSEREMNLGLRKIKLYCLPMMTCLFKGLKNSFSLKNLTLIKIMRCEKLEIVFSTSIIMCLPQLLHIRILDCKELKHMIEDDLETKTVCFPKLQTLTVLECKMLKNVFPISICKELPELQILIIREADELEEIFVCEDGDQQVNIPNLKVVAFVNLPSLSQTQGIHFQAVQTRFVQNCQELSLTNAITKDIRNNKYYFSYISDYDRHQDINSAIDQLRKETRPSSKTTKDIAAEIEVEVASGHMLTSSQLEDSTSEKPVAEPLSTISATENQPPLQVTDHKQKGIEITIEEVTALTKTLKSSTHSKSLSSSSQDQSIQEGSTSGTKNDQDIQLADNNNQVSLSPNIKEQFPMDDEIISKSKPSPSIISPIASQFPLIPSKDFDLYLHMESLYQQFQEVSKGHSNGNENQSAQITKQFSSWIEAEAASRHKLTSSQLEVSASERLAGATLSTISETIDEPPIQLVAPKQKGNEISFEEGTTSTCDKTITSSTHLEVVDGKACIPFSSIVNIIKLPSTKYVDIGDSHETFAIEDFDKLIKEDSLLAFEMFLTGVPSLSIRTLLQELDFVGLIIRP